LFQIEKRGYIREGYWADLVVVDLQGESEVRRQNLFYKCSWSPLEGVKFHSAITHTFVNGHLAYENGIFDESRKGERLRFER
jgi:dihydroorotase